MHEVLNAVSRLQREGTGKTNLYGKIPVLMISKKEEQEDVVTEHFEQNQPGNERASNRMDTNGKETKPPSLRKLLKALADDCSCTQAAVTIGVLRFIVTFSRELIGLNLANKWRVATINPNCITSTHTSSLPSLPISRTPKRTAEVRHVAKIFLLATHGQ